jgi:hypothetical protein
MYMKGRQLMALSETDIRDCISRVERSPDLVNDWTRSFLVSIKSKLAYGYELTEKQEAKMAEICEEVFSKE